MPKRRYKSKWQRYGTVIGVLFVAIGGILMILQGLISLLNQSNPIIHFLWNMFPPSSEINFLFNIISILCGIILLVVTVKQQPHDKSTTSWILIAALIAIVGGTFGGLIVFGGILIYLLVYFL